jgi:predicted AAA+ superfamily ATPase
MELCIYYNERSKKIIEILPRSLDANSRAKIQGIWQQEIPRKILLTLSNNPLNLSQLKDQIGHSISTIHDYIKKLESLGLVNTEIIYDKNKQKILKSNILCVTKNPKYKTLINKFFQGMWVDSKKFQVITALLDKHPDKYFTYEEIANKTNLPVDEVELLISNWDSQLTRALSDFLKEAPFEKKVLIKSRKDAQK